MAELWRRLRAAVLHYFRAVHPTEGDHLYTPDTRQAARENLRQYANGLQNLVRACGSLPASYELKLPVP